MAARDVGLAGIARDTSRQTSDKWKQIAAGARRYFNILYAQNRTRLAAIIVQWHGGNNWTFILSRTVPTRSQRSRMSGKVVILTGALIDRKAFRQKASKHVRLSFGVSGFTPAEKINLIRPFIT